MLREDMYEFSDTTSKAYAREKKGLLFTALQYGVENRFESPAMLRSWSRSFRYYVLKSAIPRRFEVCQIRWNQKAVPERMLHV